MWVVIPNWNLREDTIACVRSVLAAATCLSVEVVVVDNGSTDDSPTALTATFGCRVRQLRLGRNAGFAGAVNAGLRYAFEQRAASALILNNDTVVDSRMLTVLGEAGRDYGEAGILAPLIYCMEPATRIWRMGDRDFGWLPIPRRIGDGEASRPVVEADYVTGCGMLVRREVVEAIGYLDERFFMYYEDADYCARARASGFRILCVPAAKMWHRVSASLRSDKAALAYWRARGQVLFYRKHARRGRWRLAHTFIVGKTVVGLVQNVLGGRLAQADALLRGTLEGYRAPLDGTAGDG